MAITKGGGGSGGGGWVDMQNQHGMLLDESDDGVNRNETTSACKYVMLRILWYLRGGRLLMLHL